MELKDLKTGLFGFKKSSVCEYISESNREFYGRLEAQKKEEKERREYLSRKNEELNVELVRIQTRNDSILRDCETDKREIEELKREIARLKEKLGERNQIKNAAVKAINVKGTKCGDALIKPHKIKVRSLKNRQTNFTVERNGGKRYEKQKHI